MEKSASPERKHSLAARSARVMFGPVWPKKMDLRHQTELLAYQEKALVEYSAFKLVGALLRFFQPIREKERALRMIRANCQIVDAAASSVIAIELSQTLSADGRFDVRAAPTAHTDASSADHPKLVLVVVSSQSASESPDIVKRVLAEQPLSQVVVVGEALGRQVMVTLLAAGAADFVAWPCSVDELLARMQRVLGDLPRAGVRSPSQLRDARLKNIIGESAVFSRQVDQIPLFAGCDVDVLILGETGTGKEIFAQAIHYLSGRASRPWVAVNCGAIPTELMESELFGHVRGAYTNAHGARDGLVAEAEGGTLLLDDVDCLPLAAQSKLLRFLQEREYRPLGSNRVKHADLRVIASTNRNLRDQCAQGLFRQDLYYRLNVLSLSLPALRQRREDIAMLARHFASTAGRRFARPGISIGQAALRKLLCHDWPGNVRELQHAIERAVLMATGSVIDERDIELADADTTVAAEASFRVAKAKVVEQFERSFIEQRLLQCDGNVTHAARDAHKNRRAFFALMRKHSIEPDRFRSSK